MDEKETGRVEAFSDGVFAVAITLLVLNIPLPSSEVLVNGKLLDYLGGQWPILIAFVTSFATIGVMWINHHKVFNRIKYTDNALLALNLLLLLVIVFFPYPTALLAEQYAKDPTVTTAAVFYAAVNVVLAICFNLLWRYASHHNRLLREDADPQDIAEISRQYIFGPFVYLVLFGLAWVSVPASVLLILLLAVFFALPGRTKRKSRQEEMLKDATRAEDAG